MVPVTKLSTKASHSRQCTSIDEWRWSMKTRRHKGTRRTVGKSNTLSLDYYYSFISGECRPNNLTLRVDVWLTVSSLAAHFKDLFYSITVILFQIGCRSFKEEWAKLAIMRRFCSTFWRFVTVFCTNESDCHNNCTFLQSRSSYHLWLSERTTHTSCRVCKMMRAFCRWHVCRRSTRGRWSSLLCLADYLVGGRNELDARCSSPL